MKYPFYFEVQSDNSDDRRYEISTGYGLCESYTDAVAQLENHYRNDLVAIKHLELMEENDLLFFPRKVCEDYNKQMFPEIEYAEVKSYGK